MYNNERLNVEREIEKLVRKFAYDLEEIGVTADNGFTTVLNVSFEISDTQMKNVSLLNGRAIGIAKAIAGIMESHDSVKGAVTEIIKAKLLARLMSDFEEDEQIKREKNQEKWN